MRVMSARKLEKAAVWHETVPERWMLGEDVGHGWPVQATVDEFDDAHPQYSEPNPKGAVGEDDVDDYEEVATASQGADDGGDIGHAFFVVTRFPVIVDERSELHTTGSGAPGGADPELLARITDGSLEERRRVAKEVGVIADAILAAMTARAIARPTATLMADDVFEIAEEEQQRLAIPTDVLSWARDQTRKRLAALESMRAERVEFIARFLRHEAPARRKATFRMLPRTLQRWYVYQARASKYRTYRRRIRRHYLLPMQ
jgi:hypothetical protein